MELGEAYDFIETGVKPELQDYMNGQVLNELEYCLNLYDLEPKSISHMTGWLTLKKAMTI